MDFETICFRGATALLVAVATPRLPRRAKQFVPINTHATWLSRSRAMATKRKTRQHSQLSQHGEFWHVSVSERQRSRLCGQNLRVPFLRTVLPPEVGESARAMASTARQKLHHQGEFQLQNCTVGTVHDSDHEGVVRIFVGHSYHSNELFILHYAALYFLYQECNWGEPERAPHRRVSCEFSIFLYIFLSYVVP